MRAVAAARVLKAMAHPVRVHLLRELAMAERCVGDLSAATRRPLPTVSRHLAQLHAAGILRARKHGTHVFYAWRTPCVGNILTCLDNLLRRTTRMTRERGRAAQAQR